MRAELDTASYYKTANFFICYELNSSHFAQCPQRKAGLLHIYFSQATEPELRAPKRLPKPGKVRRARGLWYLSHYRPDTTLKP
jgi:hypothetical protein